MKSIVFFDFDGTLTRINTFPSFIRFSEGFPKFILGFLIFFPAILLMRMRVLPNEIAKRMILSLFFRGKTKDYLFQKGNEFTQYLFSGNFLRSDLINILQQYLNEGYEVVVVSASPDIWVKPFCERLRISCICTELEFKNGIFTGKFATPNCNGIQKKIRIEKQYRLKSFANIVAWGNSNEDIEMMKLADKANWI